VVKRPANSTKGFRKSGSKASLSQLTSRETLLISYLQFKPKLLSSPEFESLLRLDNGEIRVNYFLVAECSSTSVAPIRTAHPMFDIPPNNGVFLDYPKKSGPVGLFSGGYT